LEENGSAAGLPALPVEMIDLVPGFSVETHLKYLLKLQEQLENQKPLSFVTRKYLIEARKEN